MSSIKNLKVDEKIIDILEKDKKKVEKQILKENGLKRLETDEKAFGSAPKGKTERKNNYDRLFNVYLNRFLFVFPATLGIYFLYHRSDVIFSSLHFILYPGHARDISQL